MSRPRKDNEERRTKRIEIRLTPREEKVLIDHSREGGLTVSDFIRKATLGLKPRVQKATPFRLALIRGLAELGKIGSNVNQLARAMNKSQQTGNASVPPELISHALNGLHMLSTHLITMLSDGDTR